MGFQSNINNAIGNITKLSYGLKAQQMYDEANKRAKEKHDLVVKQKSEKMEFEKKLHDIKINKAEESANFQKESHEITLENRIKAGKDSQKARKANISLTKAQAGFLKAKTKQIKAGE